MRPDNVDVLKEFAQMSSDSKKSIVPNDKRIIIKSGSTENNAIQKKMIEFKSENEFSMGSKGIENLKYEFYLVFFYTFILIHNIYLHYKLLKDYSFQ